MGDHFVNTRFHGNLALHGKNIVVYLKTLNLSQLRHDKGMAPTCMHAISIFGTTQAYSSVALWSQPLISVL
jgi:hypothetical protein